MSFAESIFLPPVVRRLNATEAPTTEAPTSAAPDSDVVTNATLAPTSAPIVTTTAVSDKSSSSADLSGSSSFGSLPSGKSSSLDSGSGTAWLWVLGFLALLALLAGCVAALATCGKGKKKKGSRKVMKRAATAPPVVETAVTSEFAPLLPMAPAPMVTATPITYAAPAPVYEYATAAPIVTTAAPVMSYATAAPVVSTMRAMEMPATATTYTYPTAMPATTTIAAPTYTYAGAAPSVV